MTVVKELSPEGMALVYGDIAPVDGCPCAVCVWANQRIERERRLDEDLASNYDKYLAGELVSKDARE
jgi:hypothetical protein